MREKRVNLVVLTCSVVVATCASLSYCFVTADNHHHFVDKYVAVFSRAIPLFLSGQISAASAASTVWIPSEEAIDTDGSVQDEFAEVAHVFARPGVKVVKAKDEDEITQQPIPWTSLKNEWKIYQKIQSSERKKPADKLGKKKGNEPEPVSGDDEEGSSEEDEEEDDDDDEEEEDHEGRSGIAPPPHMPEGSRPDVGSEERQGPPVEVLPSAESLVAKAKKDHLPLAFYGQQNHDDDEKDYLKDEVKNFSKKKKAGNTESEEESEENDTSSSKENASVEESYSALDDYTFDDDDDDEDDEDKEKKKKKQDVNVGFDQIPLAIREMILNDLANQNNGSGYHPNLTPQVTGGQSQNQGQGQNAGGSSASVENDGGSGEDNSSEEEEDDDVNTAALPRIPQFSDLQPTPPAAIPTTKPKKGDDDEDDDVRDEDEGGKGKGKGKGKKGKKGKKGGGGEGWGKPKGWGWKPPVIHHPPPKGWGWDPAKHDGVLEQLVRGSTWERVLKYYHWKRDQSAHEGLQGDDEHHGLGDHYKGGKENDHPGLEFAGVIHGGWEPEHQPEGKIKKIVRGAFKGSFWERAVQTYAKYKENQAKNPKKPTLLDLDTDALGKR